MRWTSIAKAGAALEAIELPGPEDWRPRVDFILTTEGGGGVR